MESALRLDNQPQPELQAGGAALKLAGVSHSYANTAVLGGVDLSLAAGEHVALMGPSGAGKSTLLALIGGLEPLQAGSIEVAGVSLAGLAGAGLARYRRHTVGFIFQHFGLMESLSALENVELALAVAQTPARGRSHRAAELLGRVGLAGRLHHRPAALSGGERQRTAIARALANQPSLLLADEPTGNLDEDTAAGVLDLLQEVRSLSGCTLIVVTHDAAVAARADRRAHLGRGRIQE